MADETPVLGKLIEGFGRRDCIHIAIAPVTAGEDLEPGFHVALNGKGEAVSDHLNTVGIVDPFLLSKVEKGQKFWLLLYPGTITSLRHVWSHPAFRTTLQKEQKDV